MTNRRQTIGIWSKTTRTLRASPWNKASILLLMFLLFNCLLIVSANVYDMSNEEVKKTLDRVNKHAGNLDAVNMPTKCESCQIFARDFEVKAMEIPLKLVPFLRFCLFYPKFSGVRRFWRRIFGFVRGILQWYDEIQNSYGEDGSGSFPTWSEQTFAKFTTNEKVRYRGKYF